MSKFIQDLPGERAETWLSFLERADNLRTPQYIFPYPRKIQKNNVNQFTSAVCSLKKGYTMAKDFAKAFYGSPAWIGCREAYKKYKGGLCERCKAKGLIVPGKIVHHKCYLTPENINNPDISLNWENLELLCKACHEEEHDNFNTKGFRRKKRRYTVDDFGRVEVV